MQKSSLPEGKEFCLRENEGVVIGDNMYHVTVLDIHEDCVRLGIESPNRFPSYREEILYLEQSEELSALQLQ